MRAHEFKRALLTLLETVIWKEQLPSYGTFYGVTGRFYCDLSEIIVENFAIQHGYVCKHGSGYTLTDYGSVRRRALLSELQAVTA